MQTVQEAERIIREAVPRLPPVRVPLVRAQGRILRSDVRADRDLPPFDRVTMDGIAVSFDAIKNGTAAFDIEATAPAGAPAMALRHSGTGCLQVMTGAVLPQGCDTVVPYEDLEIDEDRATLQQRVTPSRGQFVHRQGSDGKQGTGLLASGMHLNAPRIGLAASTGAAELDVSPFPRVAVVSNGDELVPVGQPVLPYQIRPSNNYAMVAALSLLGFDSVSNHHLADNPNQIREKLAQILGEHDVLILSGGVSAGKLDYVPDALGDLGVVRHFHKVSQRPGKPMWFGIAPAGAPVFALPGNPISTLVCFHRYVLPALDCMMGAAARRPEPMRIEEEIRFEPPLTFFRPVRRVSGADGGIGVVPAPYRGSGDLSVLGASDGFVELDRDRSHVAAGEVLPFTAWTGSAG
jgi:molybdopterin molybdotransferase